MAKKKTFNARSIASLSHAVDRDMRECQDCSGSECDGCTELNQFYDYFAKFDYADHIIHQAFKSTGDSERKETSMKDGNIDFAHFTGPKLKGE